MKVGLRGSPRTGVGANRYIGSNQRNSMANMETNMSSIISNNTRSPTREEASKAAPKTISTDADNLDRGVRKAVFKSGNMSPSKMIRSKSGGANKTVTELQKDKQIFAEIYKVPAAPVKKPETNKELKTIESL